MSDYENCDDQNNENLDGCNYACYIEEGWTCDALSPTTCETVCGDSIVTLKEKCEDGTKD